jgi:hypothetical protein
MTKRLVTVPRSPSDLWLDIVSHGRGGPASGSALSPEQIEQVRRTVRRTPEVVVKVSGAARNVRGAKAHLAYIGRHGKQPILTDDGRELVGRSAAGDLVADWKLDLCRGQYRPKPGEGEKDRRPKLVHNIVLSMPGRTPPAKVLAAARKFARENFALQYRYAMVLHTDQKHPHVHLVVKCEHEFEPGKRLHVDKAMLRQWREQFAAYLREQGVAANATPGFARAASRNRKKDAIHQRLKALREYAELPADVRARRPRPKESSFMRAKVEAVARELRGGRFDADPGRAKVERGRAIVARAWAAIAVALRESREEALAEEVEAFIASLPAVRTENEQIAIGLLAQLEAQRRREQAERGEDRSDETSRRGRSQ